MPRFVLPLAACSFLALSLPAAAQPRSEGDPAPQAAAVPAPQAAAVPAPVSTGEFTEPTVKPVERPAFDAASGHAEALELAPVRPHTAPVLFQLFAGAGAASILATAFLAIRLSRLSRAQGGPGRGLTIASQLIVGCGVLTTGILALGAVATRSSTQVSNAMLDINELGVQTHLVNAMHRDVLMVRMGVKNFLLNNADSDLKLYADSAAGLADKLKIASVRVTDPESRALLTQIDAALASYQKTFADVVASIDQRNALIDEASFPSALRAVELLTAAGPWLTAQGAADAAQLNDDTLAEFQNARVAFFRFLRKPSDESRATLVAATARPQASLEQLLAREDLGAARAAISEASRAVAYWSGRTQTLEDLQTRRNTLVKDTLDHVGPQIAANCDKLLERMAADRAATEARAAAVTSTANDALLTVGILVAALGAFTAIFLTRAFLRPVRAMLDIFAKVADGDLTQRVRLAARNEMGELSQAFDALAGKTQEAMSGVNASAQQVAAAATQIAASAEEMARGMDDQSRQVQQVSAAVAQMSSSVTEIATKAGETSASAVESGRAAREGGEVVGQTVNDMQDISAVVSDAVQTITELGKRGEQIGEIIAVINDIADQTNLLALNAAIEAARAGEHGRGFAVVADEVRKLAERTTSATQEVSESIGSIRGDTQRAVEQIRTGADKVHQGVGRATAAGRSMNAIVESSGHVATLVQSIAAAGEQQATATEQITRSVEQMASVAKEANAGAGQAAQAAAELSVKAEDLKAMVNRFKI